MDLVVEVLGGCVTRVWDKDTGQDVEHTLWDWDSGAACESCGAYMSEEEYTNIMYDEVHLCPACAALQGPASGH